MRAGWRATIIAAGMVYGVCCGAAPAQNAASQGEFTQPQRMPRDADPDWDVVTVRPSDPARSKNTFDVQGRHIIVGNRTVETMMLFAYNVNKDQIVGGPDWIRTERFDADGVPTVEGQPSLKQFQTMVRKLLTERFGLVTHTEQRELPVYVLGVAKGGPKLAVTAHGPNEEQSDSDHQSGGEKSIQMENATMDGFAMELLFNIDRPVVNETKLTGRYDFKLKWTFDESKAPTDGSAAPSLFTAIEEQMGLKLEPVKRMTDVMVIDKILRPEGN